jgi:ATP-dependent Clp protease protease subunit
MNQSGSAGYHSLYTPLASNAGIPVRPDESVANRLLRSRIVVLGTQVDDDVANALVGQMHLLAADDPNRDITLFINSPGGSVTAGMAIYDTMNFIPCDVRTVAMGLAASMGQFLLCAGAPGKRFALPNARIMMHQPLGGIGGSASDIRIQAEQMAFTKLTLAELIAKHAGQPLEKIQDDSERDRWFSASEAAAYGLVDRVVATSAEIGDNK